ncbi:MAG: DUF2019 domain-containing protein [Actinobacteria bacterium]|nr:DUF2019 domain-containing protein [Actinomycetota bacterium]
MRSEKPEVIESLTQEYRNLAIRWDTLQGRPDAANVVIRREHELAKRIRGSAEGRASLEELLDDPVPVVRLAAATESLAWRSLRAEAVLEEIERADDKYAFDARWTLRTYRASKLNLDW